MRNEAFGRLLKAGIASINYCERKTAPVIEADLGGQIGVESTTIQRYKAGHIPPELRTIEILAEAGVKRGLMSREWLHQFLYAAHYPAPERLLDKLCPFALVRQRPPRIYENLPAPTYSQFIMRQQAFDAVIDGLQQRSAVVLIASLGGMGKTSLAREVATRCLKGEEDTPQCDAVVWVSDKDRPGTTTLSIVLDEIARTLDYPGFTQFAHQEKLHEVAQLLRRQRVLLVVDNFETITDGGLLSWLLRLPEPSKAIITSREKQRAFWSSWLVELHGLIEGEAHMLIDQRLRQLKIERLVNNTAQLEPLLVATGGNPKAIEVTLGLVKHEQRTLQRVVDDLYAARGELFDDLFARAWALLDQAARRVLMVMTFFLDSANSQALGISANVQGLAFDLAVERLIDLALLDVQQADLTNPPRYALHPLVRSFARARLGEEGEFEAEARDRWVGWYIELTSQVGYCWNDLSRLELLDPEQETIYAVIEWARQNFHYHETLQIVKGVSYFYNVRGMWGRSLSINLIGAEVARKLSSLADELQRTAFYVQTLSVQGNVTDAKEYLPKLRELIEHSQLSSDTLFDYYHATALYHMSLGNLDDAQHAWEVSLSHANDLSPLVYDVNRRWLATCYYQQQRLSEAEQLFQELLDAALRAGLQRPAIFCEIKLAAIAIDQGDIETAAARLAKNSKAVYGYRDRKYIAEIQYLSARLHSLRGELPTARAALDEAIDLFERLGMRHELAEAREELTRLEQESTITVDATSAEGSAAAL